MVDKDLSTTALSCGSDRVASTLPSRDPQSPDAHQFPEMQDFFFQAFSGL